MPGLSPMRRSSLAEGSATELSRALARVAGDPNLTRHLHEAFGGYCHEFRNALNTLRLSLYLARKSAGEAARERFSAVEPRYALVERVIDRFHLVCRPMTLTPVRLPLATLFDDRRAAWSATLRRHGRRLILAPPRDHKPSVFDPMRLATALDDLVAWRGLTGDSSADLRAAWSSDWENLITWDEPPARRTPDDSEPDPEGAAPVERVETEEERNAFEAFTLPLLSRVISSHGGAVEAGGPGRWRLTLRWPLDAKPT
jgi:hypothetical protein